MFKFSENDVRIYVIVIIWDINFPFINVSK